HGRLKASFPPEAMGFSISNPTVEVVDLGTEFTMFADAGGTASDVLVLKGEVEAAPRSNGEQQPMVLRESECRRFATTGVSKVHSSDQTFGRPTESVQLDRFDSPGGYAHWSFDETAGAEFKVGNVALDHDAADASVQDSTAGGVEAHAKG